MSQKRVVLAEYFMLEDKTLLFIMREDFVEPEIHRIEKSLQETQRFILENFQAEEDESGQVLTTGMKVQMLGESETIYQDFFAPLIAPLAYPSHMGDAISEEGDIIWLVPHGALHYLPLHALKLEGRYLIDRNPVCYTPSASVMKYCQAKRKGRRETALVLADSRSDLAHARGEALAVANLFNTTAYLQQHASKTLLKEKLESAPDAFDILHICCHGYFKTEDALESGVMLAPETEGEANGENTNRWNLTAREIFDLEMQADLVTLSACESGINESRPGDELIGLTRALIYAGTPSVLVSLWAVDDLSTSLLTERFYEELKRLTETGNGSTVTKAEALQAAVGYLKSMTACDVSDYCDKKLAALGGSADIELRLWLHLDKAYAQVTAGDLQQALLTYELVQRELGASGASYPAELVDQVNDALLTTQFKLDEASPSVINYDARPFEQIYYWSPFILVGDWH